MAGIFGEENEKKKCKYSVDPRTIEWVPDSDTASRIDGTISCDREAHEGHEYCPFHMEPDERPKDFNAAEKLRENLEKLESGEPLAPEYMKYQGVVFETDLNLSGLDLGIFEGSGFELDFSYGKVNGTIDFTGSTIPGTIRFKFSTVDNLAIKLGEHGESASLNTLLCTDTTFRGESETPRSDTHSPIDLNDPAITNFNLAGATVDGDVDVDGITVENKLECSDMRAEKLALVGVVGENAAIKLTKTKISERCKVSGHCKKLSADGLTATTVCFQSLKTEERVTLDEVEAGLLELSNVTAGRLSITPPNVEELDLESVDVAGDFDASVGQGSSVPVDKIRLRNCIIEGEANFSRLKPTGTTIRNSTFVGLATFQKMECGDFSCVTTKGKLFCADADFKGAIIPEAVFKVRFSEWDPKSADSPPALAAGDVKFENADVSGGTFSVVCETEKHDSNIKLTGMFLGTTSFSNAKVVDSTFELETPFDGVMFEVRNGSSDDAIFENDMDTKVSFKDATLNRANFQLEARNGAIFGDETMVSFTDAIMPNTKFRGTVDSGQIFDAADFNNADIQNGRFSLNYQANNSTAREGCIFSGEASFDNAELGNARFRAGVVKGHLFKEYAEFTDATFKSVKFLVNSKDELKPAEKVNLFGDGASFKNAKIGDAQFISHANSGSLFKSKQEDSSDITFTDAEFDQAIFRLRSDTNQTDETLLFDGQTTFSSASMGSCRFNLQTQNGTLFSESASFDDAEFDEARFTINASDERESAEEAHLFQDQLSLINADLQNAVFILDSNDGIPFASRANFQNATLVDCEFDPATFGDDVIFRRANLEHAQLGGLQAEGLVDATMANMTEARLVEADLEGAVLEGALLNRAHLINANLKGAYLYQATLGNVSIDDQTELGLKEPNTLSVAPIQNCRRWLSNTFQRSPKQSENYVAYDPRSSYPSQPTYSNHTDDDEKAEKQRPGIESKPENPITMAKETYLSIHNTARKSGLSERAIDAYIKREDMIVAYERSKHQWYSFEYMIRRGYRTVAMYGVGIKRLFGTFLFLFLMTTATHFLFGSVEGDIFEVTIYGLGGIAGITPPFDANTLSWFVTVVNGLFGALIIAFLVNALGRRSTM